MMSGDLFGHVFGHLFSSGVVAALVWFSGPIIRSLRRLKHLLECKLKRKQYVLIWNDAEIAYSHALARGLRRLSGRWMFKSLERPIEVLTYPLKPMTLAAVILIVTDVTKLDEVETTRTTIQEHLLRMLHGGGGLIGTHDIIYRRVRNNLLEQAFGCRLTDFRKQESVRYTKNGNEEQHRLFQGLPSTFELRDGEIVWGAWAPDVKQLYLTDDPYPIPLVVTRCYSQGKVVWLNSGDKSDHAPMSLSEPAPHLLTLLCNSLEWISEETECT